MIVYGLDPGPEKSALVIFDPTLNRVMSAETTPNDDLLARFHSFTAWGAGERVLVAEQIESFGMSVGASVFETVFATGRLVEAWPDAWHRVTRREVKLHLCGSMRAKDANVRQALMDVFGGPDAKGSKSKPGPLYGVSGHEFAALAVAVTWLDTKQEKP